MKVFVLSQEGKPLMPTTPRRARVWLKAKRARLVRQEPFTIRLRFATKAHVQVVFGESQVSITYGYETTYKRLQVLDLPKSHTNDAVAIACEISEVVKPLEMVHQIRCLARGHYQRFNGLHSEHKCWAPRKVRGFKLYELVKAKGGVGYIAGRREKGAFVIKDVASGKKLVEVTPRKLVRVARPTQGWMITQQPVLDSVRKEGGASSPS